MSEKTDNVLVLDVLSGNVQAYGELVTRYQRPLYNLILRMVNDEDEAKDVAQDVFVKAYNKLDQFDLRHKFFSWIYRITLNETMNYLKTRRSSEPIDQSAALNMADQPGTENEERIHELRGAIRKLKNEYKSVILLKYYSGLSYEEISEVAGIPVKKVKSRLFTARILLKDMLIRNF